MRDWLRAIHKWNPLQAAGVFIALVAAYRLYYIVPPSAGYNYRSGGPVDPAWIPALKVALPLGAALWLFGTWRAWRSIR